jgi:hypothetical protein
MGSFTLPLEFALGRTRSAWLAAPLFYPFHREQKRFLCQCRDRCGQERPNVDELPTHEASATVSNVNRAARLHRLLVILSMATARPGIRAVDLAETLKVSTRTVFRDLAELQRLGFPVTFGNGYPAQQELFRRKRRQEMSQVLADLVEQQLEVVRRKLPPEEADRVLADAIQYLPMEAAEAVTRALAKAARR